MTSEFAYLLLYPLGIIWST